VKNAQLYFLSGKRFLESRDDPVVPLIPGMIGIDMDNPPGAFLRLGKKWNKKDGKGIEQRADKRRLPHSSWCLFETS
jgi:hypothetical protein